jgi:hypothetical protein
MAIFASIFTLGVIATVSKFSVFTELVYRAGLFVQALRAQNHFPHRFALTFLLSVKRSPYRDFAARRDNFVFALPYQNNEAAKKSDIFC